MKLRRDVELWQSSRGPELILSSRVICTIPVASQKHDTSSSATPDFQPPTRHLQFPRQDASSSARAEEGAFDSLSSFCETLFTNEPAQTSHLALPKSTC